MPQTTYMQRHARHDHGMTIPDPLLTAQYKIPTPAIAATRIKRPPGAQATTEKWYGDKMNRPTRTRAQWIARARAGDDAARDPHHQNAHRRKAARLARGGGKIPLAVGLLAQAWLG